MTKVWTRLLRAVPLCTITAIFPASYVPLQKIPDKKEVRHGVESTISYDDGAKFRVQYILPLQALRIQQLATTNPPANVLCQWTEKSLWIQMPQNYGTIKFDRHGRCDINNTEHNTHTKTRAKDLLVVVHTTTSIKEETGCFGSLCQRIAPDYVTKETGTIVKDADTSTQQSI